MTLTRRDTMLAALALGLAPGLARAQASGVVGGVRIGTGTFSLNPVENVPAGVDPLDIMIDRCAASGAHFFELANGIVEPVFPGTGRGARIPDPLTPEWIENRPKLRDWRINAPLSRFQDIRRKFTDKGLALVGYIMTFTSDFTPAEIDAIFRQAEALGVEFICTNQSKVSVARRLAPYAARYRPKLAWHNHARVDDWDEVGSIESFREIMSISPHYRINLDIGHFVAGNQDPVAFIREHHRRITHLHVKDRRRNNGPNVEWGTGDTPIREVLQLVKQNRWPIYCLQEREFNNGQPPLAQVQKNMEFMRAALA